ncbi:MAG: DnaD domain-containing protein [Bacillaceae bacterium]
MRKEYFFKWFEEGSVAIPKILLNHYGELGMNEVECMVILHIHTSIESGNHFPTPTDLSKKMTINEQECMHVLRGLIQKGLLAIWEKKELNGIKTEYYSLQPLWEKLLQVLVQAQTVSNLEEIEVKQDNLYTIFEKEFGRPLSPFELETLGMWQDQDQHSEQLIKAALREAVMVGKMNFRYIDRILFEWKRAGIKSVEQAVERGQKFRQHQRQQTQPKEKKPENITFYNWLEGEV